jgi:hypothetical protein
MEETPEALSVEYRQRSWVDLPWLPATPPCSRRSCRRCHDHFIERDAVLAPIVEPVRVEAWAAPSDRGTCCLLVESHPESRRCGWKMSPTFRSQAAEMRVKVKTMTLIRARSRSPITSALPLERSRSPSPAPAWRYASTPIERFGAGGIRTQATGPSYPIATVNRAARLAARGAEATMQRQHSSHRLSCVATGNADRFLCVSCDALSLRVHDAIKQTN